mmetsp:Transcript_28744/g.80929  ORF Transcript_28744/g.80929 Transcript_28744/m.80929 type:complete len:228 (+) Transcript_28744:1320-2003(+)
MYMSVFWEFQPAASAPHSATSSLSQVPMSMPPSQSPRPLEHAWPVVKPASKGPYTLTPPLIVRATRPSNGAAVGVCRKASSGKVCCVQLAVLPPASGLCAGHRFVIRMPENIPVEPSYESRASYSLPVELQEPDFEHSVLEEEEMPLTPGMLPMPGPPPPPPPGPPSGGGPSGHSVSPGGIGMFPSGPHCEVAYHACNDSASIRNAPRVEAGPILLPLEQAGANSKI